MGQFKPMVKMETTEPSVELKLKKGGKVVKKADGGMMGLPMGAPRGMPPAMPARGGMMGAAGPGRPPLAMRRRAMKGLPAGAGPAGPVGGAAQMQAAMPSPMPMPAPGMKKGGKAEGGETKSMHKAEMKAIKGVKSDLKSHAGKSASKGHKGLATGGVVNGQGGFKKGGIINTENQGGEYRNTKMDTAKPDHSPAKTGGVKDGNAGGFATGGVAKSNAGGYKKGGKIKGMMDGGMAGDGMMGGGMMDNGMGGYSPYKKGGAAKKAFAAGGSVNSGRAVAMPQGNKPASKPVRINELAGTYKKGGRVAPGNPKLQGMFNKENATAMKQAKAQSNLKYGPASKMADGGPVDLSKGAYDKAIGPGQEDMDMAKSIRGFPGKVMRKVKDAAKDLFSPAPKADSITKTQESVTVTPGKKRGGMVNC